MNLGANRLKDTDSIQQSCPEPQENRDRHAARRVGAEGFRRAGFPVAGRVYIFADLQKRSCGSVELRGAGSDHNKAECLSTTKPIPVEACSYNEARTEALGYVNYGCHLAEVN